MTLMKNALSYFLSFEPYIMLPIIILLLALIFHIKLQTAIKSALTLGIGFIGIFMTFDYFVALINPAINSLISRSGLNMPVLDTGWPPLANIAWSFNLAPLLLLIFIGINGIMLVMKWTRTVNIDIWNYWHVIFLGAFIQHVTQNTSYTIIFSSLSFVLTLKLAEWSAEKTNKISGMDGICIPHLAGIIYYPIALVMNEIIGKIKGLRDLKADPESIQKRLGLIGEPMILGLIIGLSLGFVAGYDVKGILNVGFGFAAVVFILPKMGGILGSALIPISEGMKVFINKKFPKLGQTYIGLDVAVLFGIPSVLVTTLLLIPTSIVLALILPGIRFIPIGDLTNLLVIVAIICVATKGNIIRSYMIGIPIVIGNLYYASLYADVFTDMAKASNYSIEGYTGLFTSFLDGGNPYRGWVVQILQGNLISVLFIPIVILILIITYKISYRRQNDHA